MLAQWLMAFSVAAGFLLLSNDARAYELLPQSGTTSSIKAPPQLGFPGLTLSKQAIPKVGDSIRLVNESNPLRLGVLEEAGWDVGPGGRAQSVRAGSGPKHPAYLIPRLLLGAGVAVGTSFALGLILTPLFVGVLFLVHFGGSDALAFLAIGALGVAATALVLVVSWAVWAVGNALDGRGTYLATVGGTVLGSLVILLAYFIAESGYTFDEELGEYRTSTTRSAVGWTMFVASFFGPVVGYEISSHSRRQRRNYSVGLSPVFAPTTASAPMRVEGATLAIRRSF